MQDLKITVGGARDKATQTFHFNIRYAEVSKKGLDAGEVVSLIERLRSALPSGGLTEDDSRRVERSLVGIQEETESANPNLKEIESSLGSIGRIMESVGKVAPGAISVFRSLAAALGFTV